jgi:hypothetical protein
MNASAAIADSPLRQAGMRLSGMSAGRLAPRGLNVLTTRCIRQSNGSPVRLGLVGLRVPVSLGDCAISRRTVMNHAR